MRKTVLLFLSILLIITACNKNINDPEKIKKILPGYWIYDYKINENSIIPIVHFFSNDGNYTIANFLGSTIQKNIWKIENNKIIISYKDSNQPGYDIIIEKITESEMTVTNKRDNEKQVWKKGSK